MPETSLHITVGATPTNGLDLQHELRLVKAALLYADKVKLCSISSSAVISLACITEIDEDGVYALLLQVSDVFGLDSDGVANVISLHKTLRRKRRRTREELLLVNQLESSLRTVRDQLRNAAGELIVQADGAGLASALDSGLVELQWFDWSSESVIEEYFAAVAEAVISPETYPLFDDPTGNLIEAAVREGKIVPLGTSIPRATQVGLSSGLFDRLPLFDTATVAEIIDIRNELKAPLKQFRSAIIRLSKEIESAPWNKEFPQEVEQVFYQYVDPAVQEIDEACKSNSFLSRFLASTVTYGVPSSSLLGLMLSQTSQSPEIVAALSGAVALIGGGTKAFKKYREKQSEIARNDLYFYYRVNRALSDV